MDLNNITILQARDMLKKREVSSVELTWAAINQIERMEKYIKAFVTLTFDSALMQARMVDEARGRGEDIPDLAGIPMGLKDNICVRDVRTTCSSKMLENFIPPYSATVAERLLTDNMAIMLGKLNMDEFAMGSSTETSAFHKTHNPWDVSKVPGGSSGGSAASVAARQVFYSLGTDTGGSIRQPASFCGVVGFKPTYGAVSRSGVVAYASSLDQVGPITRDVADCALVLNSLTGYDAADSTSVKSNYPDYTTALIDDVKGIKIGVPREYFGQGLDSEVKDSIDSAINMLTSMGARVESISLPYADYALAAYYIISCAEASSNLARFDGVKYGYRASAFKDLNELYCKTRSEGFGREVKRRIMIGNYALSSGYYDDYYLKALKARTLIKQDFDNVFEKCDVILSPTSPTTAFGIGENIEDPVKMYFMDVYTVPINIAGLPAVSIPCGFDSKKLPIGMQLIGKAFDESTILRVAYAFQQNTKHHMQKPALN